MIIHIKDATFLPPMRLGDSDFVSMGAIRNKIDDTYERFFFNLRAKRTRVFTYKKIYYIMLFDVTTGTFHSDNFMYENVTDDKLLTMKKMSNHPNRVKGLHPFEFSTQMEAVPDSIFKIGSLKQFSKFLEIDKIGACTYTDTSYWYQITDVEVARIYRYCFPHYALYTKNYVIRW